MKFIILLILLIPVSLVGQNSGNLKVKKFSEELLINTEDDRKIKIRYVRGYKPKKDLPWRPLLEDFTRDFASIASTVPAYSDFEVFYEQNESLTVEELQGVKVFNVGDSTGLRKVNTALLSGRVLTIEIEVASLEELASEDYVAIVEKAIEGHKRAPYLLSNSFISYDLKTGLTNHRAPAQRKLSYDLGAMGGFLNLSPYIELYSKINYTWNTRDYVYAKLSGMNFFDLDSLQSRTLVVPMLGYEALISDGPRSWFLGLEGGGLAPGWTNSRNTLARLGISLRTSDGFSFYLTFFQEARDDGISKTGFSFQGFNLGTRYRF